MSTIRNILLNYWGYSSFRAMQEEIIQSVLDGHDTLALLPTGGGKSICFQVPAMASEGLCLVVTPLIALMKDQVENLKRRGIKAAAVYSGMHRNEIEVALSNCMYGDYKFLYISPERLQNAAFRENLGNMKINLIAVDEAHCISQWGYDFRPPYLQIAEIREFIPETPILALTATATPPVVDDIQEKLGFKSQRVFQKSFERKNLIYVVLNEENKQARLLRIMKKVKGIGIIYVRNRRKTKEVSDFLNKNKIRSDFYHAGLDPLIRARKQSAWMDGEIRIIVATNAFGMGIDKPNVRLVVHLGLADSLEAYFQEAGRAGRDGKKSYAILLWEEADVRNARVTISKSFPELPVIRKIYQSLANYYQLPEGSGKNQSYDFEITHFSNTFNFSAVIVYNALKLLEKEGYIVLNDGFASPSRVHFQVNKEELYRFQIKNISFDKFIKAMLRSYSGLFTDFVNIYENELARRTGLTHDETLKYLNELNQLEIITYLPRKDKPQIIFSESRLDIGTLILSDVHYRDRKKAVSERLNAVINYVSSLTKCRSQQLLEYFGERDSKRCGRCDVCVERNKMELSELEFDIVLSKIKPVLLEKTCTVQELVAVVENVNEDKVIKVIQWLLDNEKIDKDRKYNFSWRKKVQD